MAALPEIITCKEAFSGYRDLITGDHSYVYSTVPCLYILNAKIEQLIATNDVFIDQNSYVGQIAAQGDIFVFSNYRSLSFRDPQVKKIHTCMSYIHSHATDSSIITPFSLRYSEISVFGTLRLNSSILEVSLLDNSYVHRLEFFCPKEGFVHIDSTSHIDCVVHGKVG